MLKPSFMPPLVWASATRGRGVGCRIVDLYRHDLRDSYPHAQAAMVARILNQIPIFVVDACIVAETDVSALTRVAEFDPAAHIDRPIFRVHGQPDLAPRVKPQSVPDTPADPTTS